MWLSLGTVVEKTKLPVACLGPKLLHHLRLDVIQAGCFAVLQYSDADVEFRCSKCSRESRVVRVPLSVEADFGCLFGTIPLSRSWCATWFPVVLQCCSSLHGSSRSLRIVDHAFLLVWVTSVDSIRVCHALRRSSEMALTSSSPGVMVLSAKGSSSDFSRYSSFSSVDSGVRLGDVVPSTPTSDVLSGDFS